MKTPTKGQKKAAKIYYHNHKKMWDKLAKNPTIKTITGKTILAEKADFINIHANCWACQFGETLNINACRSTCILIWDTNTIYYCNSNLHSYLSCYEFYSVWKKVEICWWQF